MTVVALAARAFAAVGPALFGWLRSLGWRGAAVGLGAWFAAPIFFSLRRKVEDAAGVIDNPPRLPFKTVPDPDNPGGYMIVPDTGGLGGEMGPILVVGGAAVLVLLIASRRR